MRFFSRLRRSWLRPTAEHVSAFGQHRKFLPRARKTSRTHGRFSVLFPYYRSSLGHREVRWKRLSVRLRPEAPKSARLYQHRGGVRWVKGTIQLGNNTISAWHRQRDDPPGQSQGMFVIQYCTFCRWLLSDQGSESGSQGGTALKLAFLL